MRTIKLLLGILFGIAVAACGGGGGYGGGYGGGGMGGSPVGGYNISGTVSGGSTNHSGVMINLSGAATMSSITAAGGYYIFTGLANGSYTVTPTLMGYTFTPPSTSVTVNVNSYSNVNFTEAP
ncbi:SdrD B-like domain-containing protein [Sideroxydans sp. CL21]|uniref:SdrD B-like domain-containing protein n=1 Tax=Sideroxydans sp. CL21 TaxID=2600596 RepID=UPI0024BD3283|nr:SdrD B-like domain-containing protein [Sideroxydans sp. CL21]